MIPKAVEDLFSRAVDVAEELKAPLHLAIEADASERAGLAARFDLVALDSLVASAVLRRLDEGVAVHVEWSADVVQFCVVTLAPVEAHLEEAFDLLYVAEVAATDGRHGVSFGLDDPDPPEPVIDGRIDVGMALAEHFGLALDPYPRAPAAEWPVADDQAAGGEAARAPFAVLASLRAKG